MILSSSLNGSLLKGSAFLPSLFIIRVFLIFSAEFSESKYIATALVFIFQSLFIGVPILIIVNGQPTPELFVLSAIVFIIVVAMLLLIFLPKILIMRKGEEGLPSNYNPRGSTWMRSSTTKRRGASIRESSIQNYSQTQSILRSVGPSTAELNTRPSRSSVLVGAGDTGSRSKGVSFGSQVMFANDSMEDELANYGNDSSELPRQDQEKSKEINAGEDGLENHSIEDQLANYGNASDELPLQDEEKPDETDVADEDWKENHGHEPAKKNDESPVLT